MLQSPLSKGPRLHHVAPHPPRPAAERPRWGRPAGALWHPSWRRPATHADLSGGLMGIDGFLGGLMVFSGGWPMGIFLFFFSWQIYRDFMGIFNGMRFHGILLPIEDAWHLLKFGVSKGHSVGNQSNNLPFLELVAAFWLNWVRDGWRGVMFGFHFTFNVHSGWILLPCLGFTTSTLPWGCQFSQALAARKL